MRCPIGTGMDDADVRDLAEKVPGPNGSGSLVGVAPSDMVPRERHAVALATSWLEQFNRERTQ